MARGKAEGKISKRKMVEQAMGAIPDGKPGELRDYISKSHGVDISPQMISSYRSNLKRGVTGAGPGRPALPPDATIGIRDLQTIRDLVARVGVAQLHALIKMLGK